MPLPKGYRRKRLKNWKRVCARGSVRTVASGRARVFVCCPRGKWSKRTRCKVGMTAVSIDRRNG